MSRTSPRLRRALVTVLAVILSLAVAGCGSDGDDIDEFGDGQPAVEIGS